MNTSPRFLFAAASLLALGPAAPGQEPPSSPSRLVKLINVDGRTIEAEILAVDTTKVRVKRETGKEFEVALTSLDEASRKRVALWVDARKPMPRAPSTPTSQPPPTTPSQLFPYGHKLKIFFSSAKKDLRDKQGDYDDRRQVIEPRVTITHTGIEQPMENATVTVWLLAKGIDNSTNYLVIGKESYPLSLMPGKSDKHVCQEVQIRYDDNAYAKFGYRFIGWALLVEDKEGHRITSEGSTRTWADVCPAGKNLKVGDFCGRTMLPAAGPTGQASPSF